MSGVSAPGLIDLQINGAYGHDFTSDPTSIWEVGRRLPESGVTAFLPTIITAPDGVIEEAQAALRSRPASYVGAEPLGLHLEGPMISPQRPGVHELALMKSPSLGLLADWSGVGMVTLAPELAEAEPLVKALVDMGVVVLAGHSAATYDEGVAAFGWGVKGVTHLFNAMAPFLHRAPGLIGAALDTRAFATVICDGLHVDPAVIRAVWRLLGRDRFVLITDAMAAAGIGDGEFRLGGAQVQASGGQVVSRTGQLAGCALSLDQAVRNLVAFTGCTPLEALGAASTNPARLLGLGDTKDQVVFDDGLAVVSTSIGGRVVWER